MHRRQSPDLSDVSGNQLGFLWNPNNANVADHLLCHAAAWFIEPQSASLKKSLLYTSSSATELAPGARLKQHLSHVEKVRTEAMPTSKTWLLCDEFEASRSF